MCYFTIKAAARRAGAGGGRTHLLVALLADDREVAASVARLAREADREDLQPAEGRHGLERGKEAGRHVGELELSRAREVAREAHARLDVDDVEEAKHGRAAVLDLHDLEAAHVTLLDQAERVIDAEGRQDANVALLEHLDRLRAHDRRRETNNHRGSERKSHGEKRATKEV